MDSWASVKLGPVGTTAKMGEGRKEAPGRMGRRGVSE